MGERTKSAKQAAEDFVPLLEMVVSGRQGEHYPLDKPCVTIGRSHENDIVLDAPGVSRVHAQIVTSGSDTVVEDLDSRNGTYVNWHWTKRRTLEHGDEVLIATVRLRYRRAPLSQSEEIAALMRLWRRTSDEHATEPRAEPMAATEST